MTATQTSNSSNKSQRLYLAIELGWTEWKLGLSTALDVKPWRRTIRAGTWCS